MWTVELRLVSTEQWRELSGLLEEQGEKEMEMLEPALLQLKYQRKNVLEQCLTAGVQDRETQVSKNKFWKKCWKRILENNKYLF